jgi:hypothetical protein
MKVKLAKRKGYYRLVVDDKDINAKYNCTQKDPIVLATLSSWEGTECWDLRDLRLCNVIYPSPYLSNSNLQTFLPKNDEEESWITSALKQYEKREDKYAWSTFDGVVAFGDKTFDPNLPTYVSRTMEGCWSFSEGMKQFNNIREFWEKFEGNKLESSKIHNPNLQPSSNYFSSLSIMIEMEALPKDNILAKWHTMNGFSEDFRIDKNKYKPKMK